MSTTTLTDTCNN